MRIGSTQKNRLITAAIAIALALILRLVPSADHQPRVSEILSSPSSTSFIEDLRTIPPEASVSSQSAEPNPEQDQASSASLRSLLDRARRELPKKADLIRELRENPEVAAEAQHGHPKALLEYAVVMGELAEIYEADPSAHPSIDEFYRECALESGAPDSVRALCYSHVLKQKALLGSLGTEREESQSEGEVSERVVELAQQLLGDDSRRKPDR